jgi:hypothetical protein
MQVQLNNQQYQPVWSTGCGVWKARKADSKKLTGLEDLIRYYRMPYVTTKWLEPLLKPEQVPGSGCELVAFG